MMDFFRGWRRKVGVVTFLVLVFSFMGGCSHPQRKTESRSAIFVRSNLPVGTDEQQSVEFMEKNDFKCEFIKEPTFTVTNDCDDGTRTTRTLSGIKVLKCSKTYRIGVVTTVMVVVIAFDEEKHVSEIFVKKDHIGP